MREAVYCVENDALPGVGTRGRGRPVETSQELDRPFVLSGMSRVIRLVEVARMLAMPSSVSWAAAMAS